MGKLAKLLEYTYAGNSEKKRLANKPSFQKTVFEDMSDDRKELMISEGVESTTLLQEEVYNKIVEGTEPIRCVRDVFPVQQTDSNQIRVTYESGSTGYASTVPEGTPIPLDTENFDTKTLDINKIGTRPIVTNEMIEDGLWDMVEFELERAGRKLENKLNRDVIDEAVNNAGSYKSSNTVTVNDLASAIKDIRAADRIPTDFIIHPVPEAQLISGNQLLQYQMAGDTDALRNYDVGSLFDLTMNRLSVDGTSTKSYTWGSGYSSSDNAGILVCDPTYLMVGMRRDVTVEQYDDPINDLQGISATMRYGVKAIEPSGASVIHHS